MKIKNISQMVEKAASAFSDLVFPPDIYCIGCGRPVEPDRLYSLCSDCILQIRWASGAVCRVCGKALEEWYPEDICAECKAQPRAFSGGVTCFVYREPVCTIIKHLKYGGSSYLARNLGEILADSIRGRDLRFDLMVPVPMHASKERIRGYNQAALIARFAAERLECGIDEKLLLRIRPTAPMSRLNAEERRENLRGAFMVPEDRIPMLKKKRVLVVDDIYTTGSTMNTCAEVLLNAGAAQVLVASIAAGPNQRVLPDFSKKTIAEESEFLRNAGKNMI